MMNDNAALGSLGRLLASENSATDLLALLIELDPSPVSDVFTLEANRSYTAHREVSAKGHGRLDLVIADVATGDPYAALEMKGASSIHGDQLGRYVDWAESKPNPPKLFFCAFDKEEAETDRRWTRLRLRDVYAPWENSAHAHAKWLATQILGLFDHWDAEADGKLGLSTGYYINDVVTKRIARGLAPRFKNTFGTSDASATRDNAGSPMIFTWSAHPRDNEDCSVSVGVDLRTMPRRLGGTIWKLRPNVEVDVIDEEERTPRTRQQSQLLAFDLASRIRHAMTGSSLKEALAGRGFGRIADALGAGRHDGFKSSAESFDFEAWSQRIAHSEKYPGSGPFGNDRGLRLATILDLDVTSLTRHDIETLLAETVSILHDAASQSLERSSHAPRQ